jgi:hypothetical protein
MTGTLHENQCTFFVISHSVLLRMQTKFVEKIKTHILCSISFLSTENRAVYEIMWENIVEPDRPQMIIWRMRIECWIPKATNTHPAICNTNWFSNTTMSALTRLSIALYVHCLSCWELPGNLWNSSILIIGCNVRDIGMNLHIDNRRLFITHRQCSRRL